MIDGKTFRVVLDKFLISPVAQGARVQIELPNGKFLDLHSVKLLEPTSTMGKIIGKL
jgi:hypothetical protein